MESLKKKVALSLKKFWRAKKAPTVIVFTVLFLNCKQINSFKDLRVSGKIDPTYLSFLFLQVVEPKSIKKGETSGFKIFLREYGKPDFWKNVFNFVVKQHGLSPFQIKHYTL